ncbi:MAG TPA: ABC transporter ATP-binding protein [Coriobacteriia bacterium]|jgi:branched-chain amino acid transport system permease protein
MAKAKTSTMASRYAAMTPTRKRLLSVAIGLVVVLVPLILQSAGQYSFLIRTLALVEIWVLLALGLNIVVGYAGLLDLGYIAFYAMGGYAGVLIGQSVSGFLGGATYFAMLIPAALAGAVTGIALGFPVLRLRGDYLAIVTLGFGEIVRIALNNDFLGLSNGATGLPRGAEKLAAPFGSQWLLDNVRFKTPLGLFTFSTDLYWYFVVLLLVIGAIVVIRRLDDSRLGRAWVAMRENEVAAAACGVNIRTQKLWAFSLGALSGGIAGVTFAYFQNFISPESFTFMESVFVVCIVVLGGMGSIPGVIAGALLIKGVPDLIQGLAVTGIIKLPGEAISAITGYRFLVFGLLMVVMMAVRPQGMIPSSRRSRELHPSDARELAEEDQQLWDTSHRDQSPDDV